MKSPLLRPLTCLLALTSVTALSAQGNMEMGKMWTFENPPLGYLKEEYGFEPSAEWLDALRLASLRFGGGCSASFVSPKGLIMTNHHCVRGNVAEASPKGQDWVKDGFYATHFIEDNCPFMEPLKDSPRFAAAVAASRRRSEAFPKA